MSALEKCKTFGEFLYLHRIRSSDGADKPITHTRIKGEDETGKKIRGGKYHIPGENMGLFWKLCFERVFVEKKHEYLTETQDRENGGPLLVDLDFRFPEEMTERRYGQDDVILELFCRSFQELFDFNEKIKFPVFVSYKKSPVCSEGKQTKDGIHMVWCVNMRHSVQMTLREILMDKEKNEVKIFSGVGCVNDVRHIFDGNVSCGRVNWQVCGSRKPECDAYKIEHVFNVAIDNDGYDFEMKDKSAINVKAILPIINAKNKVNKKVLDFASVKQKYVQTAEYFKNQEKVKDQRKKQKQKNIKR